MLGCFVKYSPEDLALFDESILAETEHLLSLEIITYLDIARIIKDWRPIQEFLAPGVCLLLATNEKTGQWALYIGCAGVLTVRLVGHAQSTNKDLEARYIIEDLLMSDGLFGAVQYWHDSKFVAQSSTTLPEICEASSFERNIRPGFRCRNRFVRWSCAPQLDFLSRTDGAERSFQAYTLRSRIRWSGRKPRGGSAVSASCYSMTMAQS